MKNTSTLVHSQHRTEHQQVVPIPTEYRHDRTSLSLNGEYDMAHAAAHGLW